MIKCSQQYTAGVQVDQVGPVHDRTYTYSLTIGPANSEDVVVTCGIAKGKKEAKRRCCEAMVLKVSDLPPAPPLHMQPQFQMQMRGFMRFPGGRGRFMRGRGGFGPPGFRPRLPPPESEETIFKKYDRTPRGEHPSKNHPISKLCEYIRKNGWPVPQWDLINEKIIQQRKNKHGNANIMLYTFKVTIYPGKGQVEPRVYFGSGPTKKDAKFACGSVAWANIEGGVEAQAAAAASEGEARAAGANTSAAPVPGAAQDTDTPPVLDPKAQEYNPMQMAVSAISKMNERVRGMKNKEEWLETVNQNLEHEEKFKRFMELPEKLRPPTQLIKREVKSELDEDCQDKVKENPREDEEAEDGEIKEEKKKKRKSRWENQEDEVEIKKEKLEENEKNMKDDDVKRSSSRGESSSSRGESSSKDKDRDSTSRSRSRKDSQRESDHHHRRPRSGDRERSKSKRGDNGRSHRSEGRRDDDGRSHRSDGRRDDDIRSHRSDGRRDDDGRSYRSDGRRDDDERSHKSDGRREEHRYDDRRHHDRRGEEQRHDERRHQDRRDAPRHHEYEDREDRYPPRYYDQYGGY